MARFRRETKKRRIDLKERDRQTYRQSQRQTRMVQLPAAAAIEYVAADNACLMYIISSV